jgi:hypothetical protein
VAGGGTSAIKEALRNIRRGATRADQAGDGVSINVYAGAAQPGPDSEAHGMATDKAPTYPGSDDDDDDERRR